MLIVNKLFLLTLRNSFTGLPKMWICELQMKWWIAVSFGMVNVHYLKYVCTHVQARLYLFIISAALTYLRSGEFPELLRLRISMLLESGCEAFALNLCTWCMRSPVFADDVFIHRMHLTLLCTNSDQETFHEQVSTCCIARLFV